MTEVAKLHVTLGADTRNFQNGLKDAQSDINAFSRGWGGLESTVITGMKVIGGAAVAGFAALGGAIAKTTSMAASMEQGVANIASVMRLTADETTQVAKLISDLGIDPKLKVSAVEAAQAIEMLGKNGMTLEQIMGGAAKASILLANATGADFALSADVATDAMALFGLEANQMEKAVAGIVAVTQQSKFGVEDYRYSLASAAPVLSKMGVSFDEFNAVLTASASSFASGRTAGTSWRLLMQNLVPATDKAGEKMQELGFITEDGANQFFDATGELKDMNEIIRILQSGFGGLSAEQTTAYARAIFGQEALGALNASMGINIDNLNEMITSQSDVNSLHEAAATRMDTLSGQWEILAGVIEETGIQIGTQFLPVARLLVEWALEIAETYGPMVVEWFTRFAGALELFITEVREGTSVWEAFKQAVWESELFGEETALNILNFMGFIEDVGRAIRNFWDEQASFTDDPPWLQALMRFGDFVRPILQYIWELITGFVKWSDVMTAVGIVIGSVLLKGFIAIVSGAAPVIAVFAALVLAVATLRNAWENNWGGIRDKFKAVVDYLHLRFGPLLLAIEEFGLAALKEIVAWATGNATEFEAVGKIWQASKDLFVALFGDMVDFLADNLPIWLKTLAGWGAAAVSWIEAAVPTAVAAIGDYVNGLIDWIYANSGAWQNALIAWQEAAIEWIETAIPQAVEKLAEWGAAIFGWLTTNAPVWRTNLATWGRDMVQWISDTFQPTTDALKRWGALLQGWMTANLPPWRTRLAEWATAAWVWLRDTAGPKALEQLIKWGTDLMGWLTTNVTPWIAKLGEWGLAAWAWIRDIAAPKALEQIAAWRDGLVGYLTREVPGWIESLAIWGKAAWEWLKEVVPLVLQQIMEWRQNLFGFLTENLPSFIAVIGEWAVALIAWVGETIPDLIREFGDWLESVIRWGADDAAPGFIGMVLTWVPLFWTWIKDELWPVMKPALLELLRSVIEVLGQLGVAIWETAIKVWVPALWEWIKDPLWPFLKDALLWLRDTITSTFESWSLSFYNALADLGIFIMDGLQYGFSSAWESVSRWLSGLWKSIVDNAKSFFGIRSPSTVFAEIGKDLMGGMSSGISSGFNSVTQALADVHDSVRDSMQAIQGTLDQGFTVTATPIVSSPPSVPPPQANVPSTINDEINDELKELYPTSWTPQGSTYGMPYGMKDSEWFALSEAERQRYRDKADGTGAAVDAARVPASPEPIEPPEPIRPPPTANAKLLQDLLFGPNRPLGTAKRSVFEDFLENIQEFTQSGFNALTDMLGSTGAMEAFGGNLGLAAGGIGIDTSLFDAIRGLTDLSNPNAAQVNTVVSGGETTTGAERMANALFELIDLLKKEGLGNEVNLNLSAGASTDERVDALLGYMNSLYN